MKNNETIVKMITRFTNIINDLEALEKTYKELESVFSIKISLYFLNLVMCFDILINFYILLYFINNIGNNTKKNNFFTCYLFIFIKKSYFFIFIFLTLVFNDGATIYGLPCFFFFFFPIFLHVI